MSLRVEQNPQSRTDRIRPRLRPDVYWIPYVHNHRWVLHDPIGNAFYYFNDSERQAAQLLDGSRSLAEIAETLNRLQGSKSFQSAWVESLTSRLQVSGLLMPNGRSMRWKAPGKGWRNVIRQIVANPLAIRIPLLRPSGHSRIGRFFGGILFHPILGAIGCIAMAIVSFLLLAEWIKQPERLFLDITRLQGDRWVALIILLISIKSLHELGHYLACARWKADCQELGVMFLCFSPCLYCDTTNAWKLKSRWARAAIAGGGIYVELWLAVLGGLAYLNADDGLWKMLGAVTWMTCTVGTLLLNGNPCFRYDGYYILSDLWGVPNLGSQSQLALWQTFIASLGGRAPQERNFDKSIWKLVLFAIVSAVYRCMILVFLVWLIWTLLVPNGFGILALLIIGSMFFGLLNAFVRFMRGLMLEFFSPKPIHLVRVMVLIAIIAGGGWFACFVPIPVYVRSRGYVESKIRQPIVIPETAILMEVPGSPGEVSVGESLLITHSFDKKKEWLTLKHKLDEIDTRLKLLENSRVSSEEAAFEIPTLREVRDEVSSKLAIKQSELNAMTVVANSDGVVLPVATNRMLPFQRGEPSWIQEPIFRNPPKGAVLERGTIAGWLSSPDSYLIRAAVSERDVRWLSLGSSAEVILDAQPHRRWPCTVMKISPEPLSEFPQPLLGDPELIGIRDSQGKMRLETPHYLVVLEPSVPFESTYVDAIATVHFELPGKTLLQSATEAVRRGMQLP